MKLSESVYKRHVAIFFYAVVFLLIAVLAGVLAFNVLFPFLAAWCFAMALRPLVKKAHRATGISEKACGVSLCILILFLLISVCILFVLKLSAQMKELPKIISEAYRSLTQRLDVVYQKIGSYLPVRDGILIGADKLSSYIDTIAQNIVNSISKMAASIAKNVPTKAFSFVIFVISCIYFSADLQKINEFLYKIMPSPLKKFTANIKRRFCGVLAKYVKAHLIIMLITFLMVYVGLVLIGYKFAAVLAVVIAILDFLPAIGIGTVLVPWALILFITGESVKAIKLLVLFGVCETVNQILRPKIIGSQLGIHPLATLIGLYVGLKFFGIVGMFLSPLLVICVKFLLEYFAKKDKIF